MIRMLSFIVLAACSFAVSPGNLIVNADLSQGKERAVSGWIFSSGNLGKLPAEESAKVDWGLRDDGDGKALFISIAANNAQVHVWWLQNLRLAPGAYVYSYRAKGSVFSKQAKWFGVGSTIVFNGPANKFISAASLPGVSNAAWTLYSGRFFVPQGVESIDMRFTINSLGAAETLDAVFKGFEIIPQANVIPE